VAIARRLVHEGYTVVLHSRSSAEAGKVLASELRHAAYIQADLAQEVDRIRLVREAAAVWERLDVLVNNAGISRVIPHSDFMAATPTIWHELYEVNVIAKLHEIDPQTYLADVLDRIVSGRTKVNALRELLPWEWKAAREAAAA
jgi:NAD(P)-dependent dehydrogenase (short-subunit alcohol dehydrogenase family)